jgi:NADPH:quinone reductase-like Zn-dependent oxidoreductase
LYSNGQNFGAYVQHRLFKDFVLSLGANEHIDYKITAFQDVLSDIDFVLDGIGGATLMSSVKVIKEGGAIISLPSPPTAIEALKLKKCYSGCYSSTF